MTTDHGLRIVAENERTIPLHMLHQCSNCGLRDQWGESWSWYGSWRDAENGKGLMKACCRTCMQALIVAGKVPPP